jgi:hypothetical protein
MDNGLFESLSRHAASGISRRETLATLGAAGLSALVGPFAVDAKKGGKKKKKNQNQNTTVVPAPQECPPAPVDRCPAQAETCEILIARFCAGDPNCPTQVACCSLLETCDATGFFACI